LFLNWLKLWQNIVQSILLPLAPLRSSVLALATTKMLKRDLKACGVSYEDGMGRIIDFHSLRHTFATLLNKAGVTPRIAMELMRHSDMRLTMKNYTDTTALPLFVEMKKLYETELSRLVSRNVGQNSPKQAIAVQSDKPLEESKMLDFPHEKAPLAKAGNGWENIENTERGGFEYTSRISARI